MRHVARRGGVSADEALRRVSPRKAYPPTKHCGAYRREDDGSGGAGSGREAETPSTAPNSRGCQARPRFGSVSGTDRSRGRRVAQDSTPTAYMYTPSGSKDAQIARPAQGVPLPEPWPHIVRQTSPAQEAARSERRARLPETKPHVDRQTSTAQTNLPSHKPQHHDCGGHNRLLPRKRKRLDGRADKGIGKVFAQALKPLAARKSAVNRA